MKLNPVLQSRINDFKVEYQLENEEEYEIFEKFVNNIFISAIQPDVLRGSKALLNAVSTGGGQDMGIDGIGIFLNGNLVTTIADIDDLCESRNEIEAEFVFIQSKLSGGMDLAGFTKFSTGIRKFLEEKIDLVPNEKVKAAHAAKEHLLSDHLTRRWADNPTIKVYFVGTGKEAASPHILAEMKQLHTDLMDLKIFRDEGCLIEFINGPQLKTAHDSIENRFKVELKAISIAPLVEVTGVDNSCIAVCSAKSYMNILTTENGSMRHSLFYDNVRDYQGDNNVNVGISKTVREDAGKFVLLNNGITIVCDSFLQNQLTLNLKNPQVVNGCQTSYVLFNESLRGDEWGEIFLTVKVIATKNSEITNQIVRGTNSQTAVLEESFEILKDFHKDLEDYFSAYPAKGDRLYYERRSKQAQHEVLLKYYQKINLRRLIQSYVAIFLKSPHMAHRHESKLLCKYRGSIFVDGHSKISYYTAAAVHCRLEQSIKVLENDNIRHFSFHILFVLVRLMAGSPPNPFKEKQVEAYCEDVLTSLDNSNGFSTKLEESIEVFDRCRAIWVNDLRKSRDGMKDISGFTDLLISETKTSSDVDNDLPMEKREFSGIVLKVLIDRYGRYFGFIKSYPENFFFHSSDSPGVEMVDLPGKLVRYKLVYRDYKDEYVAVALKLEK